MVLRFYYVQSDDLIAEVLSSIVPAIGQEIFLPGDDENTYIVIKTVVDYRHWGNNDPTYANITVVKTRSIGGRVIK